VSDNSAIEWTDATLIVDRGGRRVRTYQRQDPTRPGQQERRAQRVLGQAWCRRCQAWLAIAEVRSGVCQPHANEEYRDAYARDGFAIRQRAQARRRGIEPLPLAGAEALLDQFHGSCAYCPAPATTWDHVEPVARGGETIHGNVVPACVSCNSSKKDAEVITWVRRTGRVPHPALLDVLVLAEVV
jgi:5-methylcytosine-specific restriction endonuclease McrA